MQLNKTQLLERIDAYYVEEARRRVQRYEDARELWSDWQEERANKKEQMEDALWTMYHELRDKTTKTGFTKKVVEKMLEPFYDDAHPPFDADPGSFYQRAHRLFHQNRIPKDEPELILEENVLEGLRGNGRFEPLKRMLETAEDATVSLSALQRLGVLGTEDSRILWGAR